MTVEIFDAQGNYFYENITINVCSLPGTPSVTATKGNGQVVLAWSAPSNGGSAILHYNVYQDATNITSSVTITGSDGSGWSCTVSGLTNGQSYSFQVSAVNAVGRGPAVGSSECDAEHGARCAVGDGNGRERAGRAGVERAGQWRVGHPALQRVPGRDEHHVVGHDHRQRRERLELHGLWLDEWAVLFLPGLGSKRQWRRPAVDSSEPRRRARCPMRRR